MNSKVTNVKISKTFAIHIVRNITCWFMLMGDQVIFGFESSIPLLPIAMVTVIW